mmetsp:Transcript_30546/g.60994  ORF Transcript_30546/g.60994 Transcript_30546/m.60994 type:complete len:146 (-) Transcript_30546:91-528(-)
MSAPISVSDVCNSSTVLPHPFHEFDSVLDTRAKGSWILVHLSTNWDISVLKCQPGIRIKASTTYNSHDRISFIQCPNITRKSNGFIAIGIQKQKQSSSNEFSTLEDGIVSRDNFLCLVQGVFLSPSGELCYIYHRLRPLSVIGTQ